MSINSTERYADPESSFIEAFEGLQAGMWTADVGIIQSVLAADQTVSVLLATKGVRSLPDGTSMQETLPLLMHLPVKFPGGGGLYFTHPVAVGDECLVVFAKRCIDAWWQSGGMQPPLEYRIHDINDGFCIPGFNNKQNALANVSQTSMQLRSRTAVIMDVSATGVTINVPVLVNSTIKSTGDQVAGMGGANISQLNHDHNYIPGSGTVTQTSPPVAGT